MIHPASAVTSLIPALSWRSRRPNAPFAELVRLSGRLSAKIPDFIGDPGRIRNQFIYAHRWRAGDLILWDNRCTLHARTDFSDKERRMLRRHVVAGDRAF
jgi:alpha-ketoglutarate-dependent taurine dioxygenase